MVNVAEKVEAMEKAVGKKATYAVHDSYVKGQIKLEANAKEVSNSLNNSSKNDVNMKDTFNSLKEYLTDNKLLKKVNGQIVPTPDTGTAIYQSEQDLLNAYEYLRRFKAGDDIKLSKEAFDTFKNNFGSSFARKTVVSKAGKMEKGEVWDSIFNDFVNSGYDRTLANRHRELWSAKFKNEKLLKESGLLDPESLDYMRLTSPQEIAIKELTESH